MEDLLTLVLILCSFEDFGGVFATFLTCVMMSYHANGCVVYIREETWTVGLFPGTCDYDGNSKHNSPILLRFKKCFSSFDTLSDQ